MENKENKERAAGSPAQNPASGGDRPPHQGGRHHNRFRGNHKPENRSQNGNQPAQKPTQTPPASPKPVPSSPAPKPAAPRRPMPTPKEEPTPFPGADEDIVGSGPHYAEEYSTGDILASVRNASNDPDQPFYPDDILFGEKLLSGATDTAEEIESEEERVEVVGVRFNASGKAYYFAPGTLQIRPNTAVVVDTARGVEFATACYGNMTVPASHVTPPLRPVLRIATEADIKKYNDNRAKEDGALKICREKIEKHGLDMKLVQAEYAFDGSKLLFYFTSAGRVDFRELVKDLASVFRIRIELRQIGIRDEARLLGGLGACGRPLCCAGFLNDFAQVTIKMAKEQNLSLNSSKISGCCGRLMCCLHYEYSTYAEELRLTPPVDATVDTPDGVGTVVEIAPLRHAVKVRLKDDEAGTKVYLRDDVKVLSLPRAKSE